MTNKFITFIEICCMLLLTGCSSIYTLTEEPEEIHKGACATGCSVIPRIYSGTAMDLCGVFSDGGQGSAIMFYDLFLSIPVDTIVLPYTIVTQITDGNLSVSSECKTSAPPNNALNSQAAPAGTPQSGAH